MPSSYSLPPHSLFFSPLLPQLAYFDTASPGMLINHLSADTDRVGSLKWVLPNIGYSLSQVVYGAAVLMYRSWQLTVVVVALLVIQFLETSLR